MKKMLIALACCLLMACATPQSFEQRLAYAYASDASLRVATLNALNDGKITVAQAQHAQDVADVARHALDLARTTKDAGAMAKAAAALDELHILLGVVK